VPRPRWRSIALASAALIASYGIVLVVMTRGGFPAAPYTGGVMPYLADKPLQEDGFYMLTVAWNIATGNGVTYNGHQTTVGFQPLQTFLYVPIAWVISSAGGDRWLFARAALALGIVHLLVFAWVASRIATALVPPEDRLSGSAMTVLLTVVNISLFRQFTNGLETGLYTIAVGVCVLLSLRAGTEPNRSIRIGCAAGLAALARIDFLVVLACFLFVEWVLGVLPLAAAVTVGAIAGAIASPWLLWVHHVTGHWIPTSGLAQAGATTGAGLAGRAGLVTLAAVQQVSPWFHVEAARSAVSQRLGSAASVILLTLTAAVLALVAGLLIRRAARRVPRAIPKVLIGWALAFAVLFAVYAWFFFATYFYPRYATPLAAIGLPLIGVGVAATLAEWRLSRALVALTPCVFVAVAWLTLHNASVGNLQTVSAGYVADNLPSSATVGAFQSGVVGYFNQNVLNLDGKVNLDALTYARKGRLPAYLDRAAIAYLVDWTAVLGTLPAAYLERNWVPCRIPTSDPRIACLARR
jgi:hypothetical protein